MRQYVQGKPNPIGLTNFVLSGPDGLPVDLFLYHVKGDNIIDLESPILYDVGEKVILKL